MEVWIEKKAYENTEKATYCMIFNEDTDKYMMQQKIREHTTEESWKDFYYQHFD